jgi:hypothetical protein
MAFTRFTPYAFAYKKAILCMLRESDKCEERRSKNGKEKEDKKKFKSLRAIEINVMHFLTALRC